jgi:glycosyltransferase involved in cell wall biosynthesis
MTIAHFTDHHLFLGGGERLAALWLKHGEEASVYYSREGGITYDTTLNFKTYKDEKERDALMLKHRDDVIVCHDPLCAESPALKDCKTVLWYVHGAFAFQLDVTASVKPKLAISNYLPKSVHHSWQRINVVSVPLGIDTSQFNVGKPTDNKKINVAIVGRISPEKIPLFWFDFLRKFIISPRNHGRFHFNFYGKYVPELQFANEFLAKVKGLQHVTFHGEVAPSKIQSAYQSNDVLMVPSLSETGSFAILEAQACGVPVIALDVDGIYNHAHTPSQLCINYDAMFARLSFFRPLQTYQKGQLRNLVIERHDVKNWAQKVELLARLATL